jgi:hypothetical protein
MCTHAHSTILLVNPLTGNVHLCLTLLSTVKCQMILLVSGRALPAVHGLI